MMTTRPSLTPTQVILLCVGSALMSDYSDVPALAAPPGNQDIWVSSLISKLYLLVLGIPILILLNKHRGKNADEIIKDIMGNALSKIIFIFIIIISLITSTLNILLSLQFFTTFFFTKTPYWALLLYIIIPVCYASYKGAGTLGRLATFIVPYILITVILFLILGLNEMDLNIIRPILKDSTFLQINLGAFLTAARTPELILFVFFVQYIDDKMKINKPFFLGILVFTVASFLIITPILLVLGLDLAKHSWSPYFVFTRMVNVYDIIQRVESLDAIAWFLGAMLKISSFIFVAGHLLSKIFNSKTHKGFTVGLSVFSYILCLFPFANNPITIETSRTSIIFPLAIFFTAFIIPLIVLIVYYIKQAKKNKKKCQTSP